MEHESMIAALSTPETDVGVPSTPVRKRGRPKDPTLQEQVKKFLAYKLGQSFFVEGAKRDDLLSFRKQVIAAGAGIESVEVEKDEIYQAPGVRTWRREGPYDQL